MRKTANLPASVLRLRRRLGFYADHKVHCFFCRLIYLCSVIFLMELSGACSCSKDSYVLGLRNRSETTSPAKDGIAVVKAWYLWHGYKVPERIKVYRIHEDRCFISAGQEDIEAQFEVDLKRMKVIRFIPGD